MSHHHQAVSHSTGEASKDNTLQKIFLGPPAAAAISGLLETCIFLPFDTISKRLMAHKQRVVALTDPRGSLLRLQAVILQQPLPKSCAKQSAGMAAGDAAAAAASSSASASSSSSHALHPINVARSLFRGTGWAIAYKASTRCVKFGFQPQVKDAMETAGFVACLQAHFGKKSGKILAESISGTVVGCFEIAFLIFDRMKVLNQTNAAALKGRGFFSIVQQEGLRTMYAGSMTTLARNIPGSFSLFFGTALTKDWLFRLDDYRKATFFQNMVASSVGATLGVLVTSPLDVAKTRIQSKGFGHESVGGWAVMKEAVHNEGFSSFYKGIVPKIISVAPRLVFTYTMTQQIVCWMKLLK